MACRCSVVSGAYWNIDCRIIVHCTLNCALSCSSTLHCPLHYSVQFTQVFSALHCTWLYTALTVRWWTALFNTLSALQCDTCTSPALLRVKSPEVPWSPLKSPDGFLLVSTLVVGLSGVLRSLVIVRGQFTILFQSILTFQKRKEKKKKIWGFIICFFLFLQYTKKK